ncbi:MAG: SURF1 family protein [Nocardioides sp.]
MLAARVIGGLAPRFWPVHLLAIAVVLAAGWLGLWQYGAYQAERAAASKSLPGLDPVPLAEALGPDDPFPGSAVGRPVVIAGEWLPDQTVLISGQPRPGQASRGDSGYWVVTPIAVRGTRAVLPVVLGWSTEPETGRLPAGADEITAWLQPSQSGGSPDSDPGDNVFPALRGAALVQRLDRDVYGGFAIAAEPPESEPRVAVEVPRSAGAGWTTGARNLFYAAEWWFFGGFAIFAWARYLRDELAESP